jgi:hypothetical protein
VVELASPQIVDEEHLDTDHDTDVPLQFRRMDNFLGLAPVHGLAHRVLAQELHAVSSNEPNSFDDAEQDPCWRRVMIEEIQSIEDNQTWSLADLPADHRAIGVKWVFKVKRDADGNVVKHKAWLVVKRYAQICGIDYDEV